MGSNGFQVTMAAIIKATRPHRRQGGTLHLLRLRENMSQVMVEHLAEVVQVPAD
jgi:hypothetical protein